jgi:DNA helicase HerA-like ATPase
MMKGQVISGEFGRILVRQKSGEMLELGELLIADMKDSKILLQVYDLLYGSQISQQNLELISGMKLEQKSDIEFLDAEVRNYKLALLKNLITISKKDAKISKTLPDFFSEVRSITKDDLSFLTKPNNPLYLGMLRSGSSHIDVDIYLPGEEVLSHHILITATTGRGKSNLTSCILWDSVGKDYCGFLVLDPHDEYYGRNGLGLKDHPMKERVVYYTTKNVPPGCRTLKINIKNIKPQHFDGAVDWSPAQSEALNSYYKAYGNEWVESVILEKPIEAKFGEGTLAVIKRRLMYLLDLEFSNNQLFCNGLFDLQAGETTIKDIVSELGKARTVIIDTSNFSGSVEILIGSMIATEMFNAYKHQKISGNLKDKPVVSIVLEEAPRVLGKEILERGSNIFSTIAREGRKFKIGLTAITQLPSLIPRDILANMNTKIILGIEMKPERQAIIESASQDLSADDRNIASLDKGEAIVSSNFARFATPIKIPFFKDFAARTERQQPKKDFSGIKLQ